MKGDLEHTNDNKYVNIFNLKLDRFNEFWGDKEIWNTDDGFFKPDTISIEEAQKKIIEDKDQELLIIDGCVGKEKFAQRLCWIDECPSCGSNWGIISERENAYYSIWYKDDKDDDGDFFCCCSLMCPNGKLIKGKYIDNIKVVVNSFRSQHAKNLDNGVPMKKVFLKGGTFFPYNKKILPAKLAIYLYWDDNFWVIYRYKVLDDDPEDMINECEDCCTLCQEVLKNNAVEFR